MSIMKDAGHTWKLVPGWGRPAGAVSGAMPGLIAWAGLSGWGRGGRGSGSGRAWKMGPGWGRPPVKDTHLRGPWLHCIIRHDCNSCWLMHMQLKSSFVSNVRDSYQLVAATILKL